jgi:ATP-dependent helicase STH1/SNF2
LLTCTKSKRQKSKNADADPLDPSLRSALRTIFRSAYDTIVESEEEETGRRRADLFLELPSKKFYPDYYILTKEPIALDKIRKRLEDIHYNCIDEFKADFRLMFDNARSYNEEGSVVHDDAVYLEVSFF